MRAQQRLGDTAAPSSSSGLRLLEIASPARRADGLRETALPFIENLSLLAGMRQHPGAQP